MTVRKTQLRAGNVDACSNTWKCGDDAAVWRWLEGLPVSRADRYEEGRNGLSALAQEMMQVDPLCAVMAIFVGNHYKAVKILYWDRNGFALWYKMIESREKFCSPTLLEQDVVKSSVKQLDPMHGLSGLHPRGPPLFQVTDCPWTAHSGGTRSVLRELKRLRGLAWMSTPLLFAAKSMSALACAARGAVIRRFACCNESFENRAVYTEGESAQLAR